MDSGTATKRRRVEYESSESDESTSSDESETSTLQGDRIKREFSTELNEGEDEEAAREVTRADESVSHLAAAGGSEEEIAWGRMRSMDKIFPWVDGTSNNVTSLIQTKLMQTYRLERGIWSSEMLKEFHRFAPELDFSVRPSTSKISDHQICKDARNAGATWIHFWFLRVMFGPCACATQSWFPGLAERYPWMLDQAATGVVPINMESLIEMGESDWFFRKPSKEKPEIMAPMPQPTARSVDEQMSENTSNEVMSFDDLDDSHPVSFQRQPQTYFFRPPPNRLSLRDTLSSVL